jgi:hypothetical protein
MNRLRLPAYEIKPSLQYCSRAGSSAPAAVDTVITVLTVLGLFCSWAAAVNLVETAGTTVDRQGQFRLVEVKTSLFYAAHGLGLASMMAAGLLSVLSGRLRVFSIGTRVAFLVLCSSAVIWAAASYPMEEVFSSEIFGATGPFVWLCLLFVLAAADRPAWTYLDPAIRLLAYASSALALQALISGDYGYYLGFSKYVEYTRLLSWLGGWTFLTATRMHGWRLLTRSIPFITLLFVALFSQSRSWLVLSCLLGVSFLFLRARERGSRIYLIRSLAIGCVLCVVAGGLAYAIMPGKLGAAADGLSARLLDDTRSGQYVEFFSSVPVTDLVLGRGPKGTWYWPGFGEYRFFDNGYLWILFEGGIPTLVCYIAIVVAPGLRALRRKPVGDDAAAVRLILIWGLALTGLSTFAGPSVTLMDFLICLYAGRCHLFLAEGRGQERIDRSQMCRFAEAAVG